jgi:hypothetical protein
MADDVRGLTSALLALFLLTVPAHAEGPITLVTGSLTAFSTFDPAARARGVNECWPDDWLHVPPTELGSLSERDRMVPLIKWRLNFQTKD